ncbi:riboflavin synthase [Endozoicomonas sp. SM1973]|uniref:Riboflavin synthase n=1 Tax=Spartinivicinus marinus TaxID=2994442 RepID=A0A853I1N6_9GAMM|nr:riboflavin synthase [Spartinivicinus marinus]MCX4025980.1 riboflavin synthase [Spartinivicinus marinus]NYZ67880.1 riboflavin synthase [Spartinivicinus marinus]
MFTGIIQAVGIIRSLSPHAGDLSLTIDTQDLRIAGVQLGDSIATNGVCLTVVKLGQQSFTADVSAESLRCSTLADLKAGDPVNLEKAMTPTTHFGGHIVSGHVDGVGTIVKHFKDARAHRFWLEAPAQLAKYIAEKGSITVDGVSLTVNEVSGSQFLLNIVPHTITNTIIKHYSQGTQVNLEVDIIARYLERLLTATDQQSESPINKAFLATHGFLK